MGGRAERGARAGRWGGALLGLGAAAGCAVGSGERAVDTRAVGDFLAVRAEGPVDVVLAPDASAATLAVACDRNLLDRVLTVVVDRTLVVKLDGDGAFAPRTACSVRSGQLLLSSLAVAGAGDLQASGPLHALEALELSGTGDLVLALDPPTGPSPATPALDLRSTGSGLLSVQGAEVGVVTVDARGPGAIRLGGQAETLDVALSGAGAVDAQPLAADVAWLTSTGSGPLAATALDAVTVESAGDGDVLVFGDPAARTVSATGAGAVVFR